MNEKELKELLSRDLSMGTERFRDRLLSRCLAQLDYEDCGTVIDDADLDLLAAAGDLSTLHGTVKHNPK